MGKDVGLQRQLGGWLRSSHSFKECVIAHQSSGPAPKMVGTGKHATEATDRSNTVSMVGERSQGREVILEGVVERWEVKMPE